MERAKRPRLPCRDLHRCHLVVAGGGAGGRGGPRGGRPLDVSGEARGVTDLTSGIEIRPIEDHRELLECERLQREIWGFAEQAVVPDHLLLTAIEGGGCLLGAYDGEKLIGFVFSLVGLQDNRLKHSSLMAGVLPEARYRGIGHRLKLAQRAFALKQGIELITWTFDPLQSANAHFNFKKLGTIARRYERDYYGDMRDQLNRDLPSDRLLAEWWLASPRVEAKIGGSYHLPTVDELLSRGAIMVTRTEKTAPTLPSPSKGEGEEGGGGWLANVEYRLDLEGAELLVEIPTDTPEMKAQNLELARRWRAETRAIFERYLAQGYLVSEFITEDKRRGYYLLEQASPEEVLERG
ncbi:MAG: hypothetical protein ACE5LQ_06700 [Candidatus Bipolaricaulia bacterium]